MNKIENLSKKQIIDKAISFHLKGNIQEAIKYYQHFINQGFIDHNVFSNYGLILKDLNKLKEAEIFTRKAIELNPNLANPYSNLGVILEKLKRLKEAELYTRKAIELNPNFASAYSNLGNLLRDLGNLKEAELYTRKAIQLNPNLEMAYFNLGAILRDLGNLKEAELHTRKAIQLNPNLEMAYSNLGGILRDLGNLKEAELYTRKAIQLNPNLEMAYSNLGFILNNLGNLDELLLTSKAVLLSKSINQGCKLIATLEVAIANLLRRDLAETYLYINKVNKLISKGAINTIKDPNNRKNTLNYSKFITSLYPLLKKENQNLDLEKIPHFGESHCLSFAHQHLSLESQIKQIQPVLIKGAKSWHFASSKHNQWKDSLTHQIKNHTYSDSVFISFGEIDCRKDEGILPYSIKTNKNINEVCENTINKFLNHMEMTLSLHFSKRYYFGIPAPLIKQKIPDELNLKRINLIKIYNSLLKEKVLSKHSFFVDIYKLTARENGVNNNLYMCD